MYMIADAAALHTEYIGSPYSTSPYRSACGCPVKVLVQVIRLSAIYVVIDEIGLSAQCQTRGPGQTVPRALVPPHPRPRCISVAAKRGDEKQIPLAQVPAGSCADCRARPGFCVSCAQVCPNAGPDWTET